MAYRKAHWQRQNSPALHLLRVGPHEVAEGTLMRDLAVSVNAADLVQRLQVGAEAPVHAQHLVVNQLSTHTRNTSVTELAGYRPYVNGSAKGVGTHGGDGEQVEDAAAVHPGVGVAVLGEALVVEAVHLRDLPRLVVTAQQGYPASVNPWVITDL